jgi:hypothetical protein
MADGASLWGVVVAGGAGFLLGCRHGLDWDHIAAITDLAATGRAQRQPLGERRPGQVDAVHGRCPPAGTTTDPLAVAPRSLGLALWYCIGHGAVILLLGLAVAVVGVRLPDGIDRAFEVVVGVTLVGLGAVVLWQLGRDRSEYRYVGRWRFLIGVVRRAWARARRRGAPREPFEDLGRGSAFAIGVLHGTGAETPTQVVLVASAATVGSTLGATIILGAFVAGLVVCDLGIAAFWLAGLVGAGRRPAVQVALGALTGMSSLGIGALFVSGRAALLPALFGG